MFTSAVRVSSIVKIVLICTLRVGTTGVRYQTEASGSRTIRTDKNGHTHRKEVRHTKRRMTHRLI